MRSRVLIPVALFVTLIVTPLAAQGPLGGQTAADRHKSGHSKLGEAFDEGPRERPAKIDGIGRTSFPITTSKPEVQEWFDQGHTLLHSFWFFEAERAFRWAVKLDPDAPMPYWGLARTASGDRARAFLREASSRKARGTPRERDYIEAWEVQYEDRGANGDARKDFHRALERLIIKYPDDVEAKALYAYEAMAENRVGTELLIRQVLAVDPNHPGAHHYRIHNWDDEDGAQALESCKRYGTLVPGIGHALHMPGHIYAGLGMYHEAAISLDSATRAEIAYMARRMVFPYNTWNYAHNRNYLSYVQEQLGLPSEAIRGARELLAVPLDPKLNDATRFSPHWQGVAALTRALIKFERWDEILAPGSIPWGTSLRDRLGRGYAEALAKIEKKDPAADIAVASFGDLKKDIEKPENCVVQAAVRGAAPRAAGHLRAQERRRDQGAHAAHRGGAEGADAARGVRRSALLPDADVLEARLRLPVAEQPEARRRRVRAGARDGEERPVRARRPGTRTAGARRHEGGDARRSDAPCYVWSDAEPGLRWLDEARSTGLRATAVDVSPGPQRNYRAMGLDKFGPAIWQPFAAPALDARNSTGARVTLDQFKGRNVLLVFYLGDGLRALRQPDQGALGARRTSGRGSTRTSWRSAPTASPRTRRRRAR